MGLAAFSLKCERTREDIERMTIEKIDLVCCPCSIVQRMVVRRQNLGQDTLRLRYHPGDNPSKWA